MDWSSIDDAIPKLESDILVSLGYKHGNPYDRFPTTILLSLAKEKLTSSPLEVLLVALSSEDKTVIDYALRNKRFPTEHMDALLTCYREHQEKHDSVMRSGYYHKYQELLTNPKVPGDVLLRYLAEPADRDTFAGPRYIKRLWRVLGHPNVPEDFLLDFLDNRFPTEAHSSNVYVKAKCVSIIASNPNIPDSVARRIAHGDPSLVKQETLAKLARNKGVDKEVVRLLLPDAKGKLHDGRVASVELLKTLVTNLTLPAERAHVVHLLGKRSGSSYTQYLVACFSEDKEALANVASFSKNRSVALAAAKKSEDPEAYSVLVLLRDLPVYATEKDGLKKPRLRK